MIYNPTIGTPVEVGDLTIKLTFVPDDLANEKPEIISRVVSVGKRTLVVTMDDVTVIQGETNVSFDNYSVEGFLDGESQEDLDSPIGFEITGGIPSSPGSYPIQLMFEGDDHYELLFTGANLIVESIQPALSWTVMTVQLKAG